MPKAIWNGKVIAESEEHEVVEGNVYFPRAAVKEEYLEPSDTTTHCPWKGTARYYTLVVDGAANPDAAWTYPDPEPAAAEIAGHIAFWRGVRVEGQAATAPRNPGSGGGRS